MSTLNTPARRSTYSAIVDRPPLKLPENARMVIWTIVNLEFWSIERPMARQVLPAPTAQVLLPDIPNWAWHEYGMRVGFWRFKELFDRMKIIPTLSINARVAEEYPRVTQACLEAGWEFMGHAYEQMPIHKVEEQRAMIERTRDVLQRFSGQPPLGWLGPGLTQTLETPDLLTQAGYKYIGDFVYDDEPTTIDTLHGPLTTLPYTVEINDIIIAAAHYYQPDFFMQRAKDQFDRLYKESASRAKFMAIAIHPYISGVPHRIGYLERIYEYAASHSDVLFWNGRDIYNWYHQS